jgi:uncharacterized surface protein with fasciclin (FAS1) repeats
VAVLRKTHQQQQALVVQEAVVLVVMVTMLFNQQQELPTLAVAVEVRGLVQTLQQEVQFL